MKRFGTWTRVAAMLVFGLALLGTPPAEATAPGTNGRIVYSRFADRTFSHADIVSANPDGTGIVSSRARPSERSTTTPTGPPTARRSPSNAT
jgi:hypothetical protein